MADALAKLDTRSELARVELNEARARLAYAVSALKGEAAQFNVPRRIAASINRHPLLWVGGAIAVGALLGRFTSDRSRGEGWKRTSR